MMIITDSATPATTHTTQYVLTRANQWLTVVVVFDPLSQKKI